MKRSFVLPCVFGMAVFLFAGCHKKQPQLQQAPTKKVARTAHVAPVPKPRPVKPPKEIAPGTRAYLDLKNGFRDVTFGQSETNITDLVLKSQDETRQMQTFTRSGDELSLEGVPLENIEYSFFQGKLFEIRIKWNLESKDSAGELPSTNDVWARCAMLYGRPTRRGATKDGISVAWRGRNTELVLVESRFPGVPNRATGGWAIPPKTAGRMVIRSLALARSAEIAMLTSNPQKQNGL